jgi:chromosome segregation ATPase
MVQREMDVIKFKHDIETITNERDIFKEKFSTVNEDKARLELDLNSTTHTVDTLNTQLQQVKSRQDIDESHSLSISLQIQQTIKNRLLKYDLENKQLNDQLTSLKQRYEIDMHTKRTDEEKQHIHVQLLNEQINEYLNNLQILEIQNDQLIKEKFNLQNQIQDQRIEYDKIRSELEANNKHLKLTLNTIQQREQMETTAKFQDIEQENKRLQDRMGDMMQQISQLQVSLSVYTEKKNFVLRNLFLIQKRFRYLQRIRNSFLVSYNTIQIFKNVSWMLVKSF